MFGVVRSKGINNSKEISTEFKILYIDDDFPSLVLMSEIIKRLNINSIEMIAAKNGNEGLNLAKAHIPDLIILDINLPEIDGFEVFEKIQKSVELKDIPVIAVSASSSDSNMTKAYNMGFAKYIIKPLCVEHFLKILNGYMKTKIDI